MTAATGFALGLAVAFGVAWVHHRLWRSRDRTRDEALAGFLLRMASRLVEPDPSLGNECGRLRALADNLAPTKPGGQR